MPHETDKWLCPVGVSCWRHDATTNVAADPIGHDSPSSPQPFLPIDVYKRGWRLALSNDTLATLAEEPDGYAKKRDSVAGEPDIIAGEPESVVTEEPDSVAEQPGTAGEITDAEVPDLLAEEPEHVAAEPIHVEDKGEEDLDEGFGDCYDMGNMFVGGKAAWDSFVAPNHDAADPGHDAVAPDHDAAEPARDAAEFDKLRRWRGRPQMCALPPEWWEGGMVDDDDYDYCGMEKPHWMTAGLEPLRLE